MKNIGFLFEDLANSQKAYSFIYNTNRFLDDFGDEVSICAFVENNSPKCIVPCFGVYFDRDIRGYQEPLIATSARTAVKVHKSETKNKIWYIYDLDWMITKDPLLAVSVNEVLKDPSVTKLARSLGHADVLKDLGITCTMAGDFNMETIYNTIRNTLWA